MDIYINLGLTSTKLSLTFFLIIVFFLLYQTIPDSEFDNVSGKNCIIERLYYTITNQVGIRENDCMKPSSYRAKFLTVCQILLSYSILLL